MKFWLGGTHDVEYTYHKDMSMIPLTHNKPVIVVIDPGKTNMAMCVSDVYGKILQIVEMSGTGCDTDVYCRDVDLYIKSFLSGLEVIKFFQENTIIPQKRDNVNGGYKKTSYRSTDTLSEIKGTLRRIALDITEDTAYMINNKQWKASILPDGYRGNEDKGSYRWMCDLDPKNKRYTHDVTDVLCMLLYALKVYNNTFEIECDKIYDKEYGEKFFYEFIDSDFVEDDLREFNYNETFSLEQNLRYYKKRSSLKGKALVDINWFKPEDLLSHCNSLTTMSKVFLSVT